MASLLPRSLRKMISTAPFAPSPRSARRPGVVHVRAHVFGCHDVIGAAIGLARDDGDLRRRRLGIGEEQLGAMLDEPSCSAPRRAGIRALHKRHDRNVETVAEAHEARGLARGIVVEHACQHHGLVATKPTVEPSMRPNPVMMLRANASPISKNRPRPRPSGSVPSCRKAVGILRHQRVERTSRDGGDRPLVRPYLEPCRDS